MVLNYILVGCPCQKTTRIMLGALDALGPLQFFLEHSLNKRGECELMLPYSSKISRSQQPFFTATVICIVKRWKWSMGHRFAPECNHTVQYKCPCINENEVNFIKYIDKIYGTFPFKTDRPVGRYFPSPGHKINWQSQRIQAKLHLPLFWLYLNLVPLLASFLHIR